MTVARRKPFAALLLATILASVSLAATGGVAIAEECAEGLDVNGDGIDDVAVSAPTEDLKGQADAGAVHIVLGGANNTTTSTGSRIITQEAIGQVSEKGDRMGASLAVVQWNPASDYCADLVIGIPGEDGGKGIAVVLFGSPTGLKLGTRVVLRQGANGTPDSPEAGDRFAEVMSAGGTSVAGTTSALLIGVPGEDISGQKDAGMVMEFDFSSSTGTISPKGKALRQGAGGIPDSPESGDQFGAAVLVGGLSATGVMAIGVPGEDIGGKADTGAVHELWLGGESVAMIDQNSPRVAGTNQAGDRFGSALATTYSCQGAMMTRALVIGVPGKDVAGANDAGAVVVHEVEDGSDAETMLVQGSGTGKVGEVPEAGDRFGASITNVDSEIAIGSPGEDVGSVASAGMVTLATMKCVGEVFVGDIQLASAKTITQNSAGIPGQAQKDDGFGTTVGVDGTSQAQRFVIGAPGDKVGTVAKAGSVTVMPVTSGLAKPGSSKLIVQGSGGMKDTPETGDALGGGLLVSGG